MSARGRSKSLYGRRQPSVSGSLSLAILMFHRLMADSLPVHATIGLETELVYGEVQQLENPGPSWLDILKMLVSYGASVHEVVHGMTISFYMLESGFAPRLLEALHFLHGEQYVDFDSACQKAAAAIVMVPWWKNKPLAVLAFLSRVGVNMSRILDDGGTLLHLAAWGTCHVQVLELLCSSGCLCHINRQNDRGWTPLHLAILSSHETWLQEGLTKVRFLLRKGAIVTLRAHPPDHAYKRLPRTPFTPLKLAYALSARVHEGVVREYKAAGHRVPRRYDIDQFEDALETQELQL